MDKNYDVITFYFQNIIILRRSGVVIFADIIKVVTMTIKTIMYQNAIYICFFDIAKFTDFRRKDADVSRIQEVCHVIISLGRI